MTKPASTTAHITFAKLVRLEPRLAKLQRQAKAETRKIPHDQSFCGKTLWEGSGCGGWGPAWMERLDGLVGPKRKEGPTELQTWLAFEIAFDEIYYALPACQGYCQEEGTDSQILGFREETWIWPQPGAWVSADPEDWKPELTTKFERPHTARLARARRPR